MKWKNRSWVTIWLILVCVALVVTGTYAAYTKEEYQKRVVASKNVNELVLFSSNYLFQSDINSAAFPLRMIPVNTSNGVSVTVTVCNYPQSDLTRVSEGTITYNLTAQLVDLNNQPITNDSQVTYQLENGSQQTIYGSALREMIQINNTPFSEDGFYSAPGQVLQGGTAWTHFYTITTAQENIPILNAVGIRMVATPSGNVSKRLSGLLRLGSAFEHTTPWGGVFTDPMTDTTKLDAFNYMISGTVEQTMRLAWNEQYVTLGKWSREQLGVNADPQTDAATGMKYIDVHLGAVGTPTSYTLQFYRVNGIPLDENETMVASYVSFGQSPASGS